MGIDIFLPAGVSQGGRGTSVWDDKTKHVERRAFKQENGPTQKLEQGCNVWKLFGQKGASHAITRADSKVKTTPRRYGVCRCSSPHQLARAHGDIPYCSNTAEVRKQCCRSSIIGPFPSFFLPYLTRVYRARTCILTGTAPMSVAVFTA